jgi:DNA-binding LacI/PurR family transcriptional regulator
LQEAGIKLDRELVLEGDFRHESGYRLGKELMRGPSNPTAVFVCNGVMTLGLFEAFEQLSVRCPDDIGVATFDDLAVDRSFHPHLTTVVQPNYEIGARSATILMDRIEGKLTKKPVMVRIAPTLVVRESSGSGYRINRKIS